MSNMSKNLIGLKTFTVESLSVIQRKLARVAGEVSQSPTISGRLDNMDPEFERVKRRINELERQAQVYATSSRDDARANLGVDVAVLK
jgi:phage shock protein A